MTEPGANSSDPIAKVKGVERLLGARRRAMEREVVLLRRRMGDLGKRIEVLDDQKRMLVARARLANERVRLLRARAQALARDIE